MKKIFAYGIPSIITVILLFYNGFTMAINTSGEPISVSVENHDKSRKLLRIFNVIFIGFPDIEGNFVIKCAHGTDSKHLGYTTKSGFNRIIISGNNINC